MARLGLAGKVGRRKVTHGVARPAGREQQVGTVHRRKRMTKYVWIPGTAIAADAQACGEQLASLEQQTALTPRVVVDAARPADAPLHPAFEWNDAAAAEAHRETQAQRLLGAIRVVRVKANGQAESATPAFAKVTHRVVDTRTRSTATVRHQPVPTQLEVARGQLLADLDALAERYTAHPVLVAFIRAASNWIFKRATGQRPAEAAPAADLPPKDGVVWSGTRERAGQAAALSGDVRRSYLG
jgi:hypothetical protein